MSLAKTTFAFTLQKITGTGAAVRLVSVMPTVCTDGTAVQPTYCMFVNDANTGTPGTVRWSADGTTTPTSTIGTPIQSGGELDFDGPLAALKFFIPTGTVLWLNFFA